MRQFWRLFAVICAAAILSLLPGCEKQPDTVDYHLNMNTEYAACRGLEAGEGHQVPVILLLGQSNASGCSLTEYLQMQVPAADFEEYQAGYENVRINYCIDDHSFSSQGQFVPVDLTCGCGNGFFGPELGMAEVLSREFPEETVYMLKYTMSGYSLNHHWLSHGARGDIYTACLAFVQTYLDALSQAGYRPQLSAICWMQGESDTTEEKGALYYDNQVAFAGYLREDLAAFAPAGGIWFLDAGISSSPYCEPAYPAVNAAKAAFAALSPRNVYFSTIDMGLTTLYEPDYAPDLGHFDCLSQLALGREFGRLAAEAIRAD